ncbi:FkbM family methyltransferase [Zwartia sp.]|uniref:FkbM family methyltransferase n=1 Tax=Zwartia sp. TaxID=2978004 RepID=UPI003BB0C23F
MPQTRNMLLTRIKSFLKKIPFLIAIKRHLWLGTYKLAKIVFAVLRSAIWAPLFRTHTLRELVFDTTPTSELLLANTGKEVFVISAQDRSISRMIYSRGVKDFESVERVVKLLAPTHQKKLLIDIGANIGTICIPAVKRDFFKYAIAVEPEPFNFSLLQTNIHLNELAKEITTHNIALGESADQEILFELSETNFGDHRIRTSDKAGLHGESTRKTVSVKSERFDDLFPDLDPNETLIWIDTQGYEGYILAGASLNLVKNIPLVVEFWPYGMNRSGSFPALKASLLGKGYTSFYDLETQDGPLPLTEENLQNLYTKIGITSGFTDLLII